MNGTVRLGGQKFRGNRSIQDIQKDIFQAGFADVRHMVHDIAHQGLGHGGVDAIHGHVVAVIGGPAQGQLGEIAGAHHHAVRLIGHVHQHLGALAGLAVFIGHVPHGFIMADVPEMLAHSFSDVDFAEGNAQLFTQALRVGTGALCGAETGHGYCQNIPAVAL